MIKEKIKRLISLGYFTVSTLLLALVGYCAVIICFEHSYFGMAITIAILLITLMLLFIAALHWRVVYEVKKMKVKTQIKMVLLMGLGTFFILSGLWTIYMGLYEIIDFGGIYINLFNIYVGKTLIFYTIGILVGIVLSFIINSYIRPTLKNIQ